VGRQLFASYPVFRQSILEQDVVYKARTGKSMVDDLGLFGSTDPAPLPDPWPIAIVLPTLTAVQCALFDLLVSFGLQPDALIGHSAGETSLLYASGAGSKEMALEVSIARGIAMTIVEQGVNGTMAAFACSAEVAEPIIKDAAARHPDQSLEIACYNSPDAITLAGHVDAIDDAVAVASAQGIMARKIKTRTPVHSSLMEACKDSFRELVEDVFRRYPGAHVPRVTTFSTLTEKVLDRFTAEYYWQNTRGAVRFATTFATLLKQFPEPIVMEHSPHPVLAAYVGEMGVPAQNVLGPMRRSKTVTKYMEQTTLLNALGQFVVAGGRVDFNALNGRPKDAVVPRLSLPAYPFAKRHVDYYPEVSQIMYKQFAKKNGPLNFPHLRINSATHPELADHVINQEPIMPAAGFIEMVRLKRLS
jgi:acyl transferase domain-containing protein